MVGFLNVQIIEKIREILSVKGFPILSTAFIGLTFSFLILKKKETQLTLDKIKNPLSIKGALIFSGTYLIGLIISIVLSFFEINILAYYIITFAIGFLSGGASSLFVATAFYKSLVNEGNALLMLTIGLSAAIINKIFYSTRAIKEDKNKKGYVIHLVFYIIVTIFLLITMTFLTIFTFNLSIF